MSSAQRIEANRLNAQKSTGPKTPEGKAASSQNAVKHGLTSRKHILLPDEKPDEFHHELGTWLAHYGGDPAQAALAERACTASWKLRRLDRQERAVLSEQARHAPDLFDIEQIRRAQTLGEKLLHDPLNRCQDVFEKTPEVIRLLTEWRATEPAVVKAELESFAAGVDWMLARWAELNLILETEGFWHYDARYHVTKLLGRRPEDVMRDPAIRDLQLSCNVLHPQAWKSFDDAYQATIGTLGRPVYYYRVETFDFHCKPSKEDAIEFLRHFVTLETTRLRKLKAEHLDALAAADRAEAPLRAMFDAGPGAALRLRYEIHLDRTLRADVAELLKYKKAEAKGEIVPVDPAQVAAWQTVTVEQRRAEPAGDFYETFVRNEPSARPCGRSADPSVTSETASPGPG